jgi:hypothetical protein
MIFYGERAILIALLKKLKGKLNEQEKNWVGGNFNNHLYLDFIGDIYCSSK